MSEKNGGQAFPGGIQYAMLVDPSGKRPDEWIQQPNPGMSLRDYFAAKAMAALIVEPQWNGVRTPLVNAFTAGDSFGDSWGDLNRFAAAAYKMSDAMLRAREVKP